MHPLENN